MKHYILTFTTLLILIIPFYSFAQDSTKEKHKDKWKWEWDEFDEWKVWKNKQPAISLNYGFSDLSRKDIEAPFADNNLIELKLGYRSKQTTIRSCRRNHNLQTNANRQKRNLRRTSFQSSGHQIQL